ncbi:MAG: hypothetical protein SOR61_09785 [Evtepia sp.]|uniref:hypothetical protein n=1 Tax=Evtepia sp. TaxID=2773933 RepID=UPI002A75F22B|nr:hypothetical protein [Evtepia sp.]MDY3015442.1 hypothetical protein [Evtepia sp.]
MKKVASLLLAVVMALTLSVPALAADPEEAQYSAMLLYNMGLFQGGQSNPDGSPQFELDRAPTRAEAITVLVRLMGAEKTALSQTWSTPFVDVPKWAQPYVGYAYHMGYTDGVDATHFDSNAPAGAQHFLTFLLRALDYKDNADFVWTSPWTLTDQLGITHGEYSATAPFLRGDVTVTSVNALYVPKKGSDQTLLEHLAASGAITGSTAVIWDYSALSFLTDFASFLFFPVSGSPASFVSFEVDKVTVNGLSCDTMQLTNPDDVAAYLASIGYNVGGFGYIEVTYDQSAAEAAATEYYTDDQGNTYPLLGFSFSYTATQADGSKVKGSFTDYYYIDEVQRARPV